MATQPTEGGWAKHLDAAWGVLERFGTAIGIITLTAAGPTGHAIGGGVTALYYIIPLSTLALFFLWAGNRRRERELSKPSPSTPLKQQFTKEHVRIRELSLADSSIRNCTFVECVIEGPIVLYGQGGTNNFSGPGSYTLRNGIESMFILVGDGKPAPAGAFGLIDCNFVRCDFIEVGIAMTRIGMDKMKGDLGITESPHQSTPNM